jgi:hypothetical protein
MEAFMVEQENIEDLKRRLLDLVPLAEQEGADMLAYLITMAATEADDVLSGIRPIDAKPKPRDPKT